MIQSIFYIPWLQNIVSAKIQLIVHVDCQKFSWNSGLGQDQVDSASTYSTTISNIFSVEIFNWVSRGDLCLGARQVSAGLHGCIAERQI